MDWWGLDRALFRAIHLNWREPWLDPIMALLSFSGVGIVHVGALLCASARNQRIWFWVASALVVCAVTFVGAKTGDQWVELGVFLVLLRMFWWLEIKVAIEAIAAFLLSGGFHLILKAITQRERPSNFIWASPMESVYTTHSFPSGHATTAVAIGTIIYMSYARQWQGWVALSWGLIVAVSRIYVGVHWPSDVLAGIGLGVAAAAAVKIVSAHREECTIEE
ncbi:MAG: phosphatase PAP2 family protein [Fimbriimonadaceae bacterium]|nr:phosphatase PAP2 family protein [Fimbriimonadaceae bacterium]